MPPPPTAPYLNLSPDLYPATPPSKLRTLRPNTWNTLETFVTVIVVSYLIWTIFYLFYLWVCVAVWAWKAFIRCIRWSRGKIRETRKSAVVDEK
jgi:hypothetical protein